MFVHDEFGNLVFVPRSMCFAEGDEGDAAGGGGSEGGSGGSAEGAGEGKAAEGAGEGKGKEGATGDGEGAGEAGKGQQDADEADWRSALPDDLKKHAKRFNSVEDLVKANVESRQKLSKAIVPPGKDASEEDVAAYRKLVGVPDKADGYKFEMPGDAELTEIDQAFHSKMAEVFHAANVSKEQAQALNQAWNEMTEAGKEAQIEADQTYAEESMEELRRSWGKDFEANKAFAQRAAEQMFGDEFDDVRKLETSDGRFVLDNPAMMKGLATIGREMAEGTGVPRLDGEAKEAVQDQLRDLQDRINKAQESKDQKLANKLYQQKLALTAKMTGSTPIVGAQGRAV